MKLFYALIICFLLTLPASFVEAEYYQYIDKDGTKHFTDDISDVPVDQRPGLKVYHSIQSLDKKELPEAGTAVPSESLEPSESKTEKDKLKDEYKTLVEKRAALENESAALIEKRQMLTQEKETIDIKEYNERVTQLNAEITLYQEKSAAYEALVNQYNERINPQGKKEGQE